MPYLETPTCQIHAFLETYADEGANIQKKKKREFQHTCLIPNGC
jgi:hypothetical protein